MSDVRAHGVPTTRLRERVAPPVAARPQAVDVGPVLRSPTSTLDAATRGEMESRFGRDLSRVRVHTDERAARAAHALGAAAFTVGEDVVFGRGSYQPGTKRGRALIAHELTHVVQQDGVSVPERVEIGPVGGEREREADANAGAAASGGASAAPARTGRAVVQRSLLGGIAGGLVGAAGGAVVGGLLGGPIGAVLGGVAGLVGAALVGDAASTRSRRLTAADIDYVREVFRDTIDYSKVTVTRDSLLSTGAPKTIGNTVHLRSEWGAPQFDGDTMNLTGAGRLTLVHELAHVWQYQNGGLAYIPASLIAQFGGFLGSGNRDAAYDWREADRAGLPWEQWNPEQQASAVEQYNLLLRESRAGTATASEIAELAVLAEYMKKVWAREGAPTFFGRSPSTAAVTP